MNASIAEINKNTIAEKNLTYPENGLYKGNLSLVKHWSGKYIVQYKELCSPLFNDSFTEKFETLGEATGFFNAKLLELENK